MSSPQGRKAGGKDDGSPSKKMRFIDLSASNLKKQNNLFVQRCKGRFILAFGTVGDKDSRVKAWCEPFKKGKFFYYLYYYN